MAKDIKPAHSKDLSWTNKLLIFNKQERHKIVNNRKQDLSKSHRSLSNDRQKESMNEVNFNKAHNNTKHISPVVDRWILDELKTSSIIRTAGSLAIFWKSGCSYNIMTKQISPSLNINDEKLENVL